MVRKDDCLNCPDKIWEVNGDPFYHPATGMRRCANNSGGVATPKTLAESHVTVTLDLADPGDCRLYHMYTAHHSTAAAGV